MIDQQAVKLEFRNRLLDELEDFDEANLKIDNKNFVPPNPADLWIRETLIPGDDVLIANNELEMLGILQYDVFVPPDTGVTTADKTARQIGKLFKATTGFDATNDTEEESQICVYRTSMSQGRETSDGSANWYMRSVRIFFRAYAQNHSTT